MIRERRVGARLASMVALSLWLGGVFVVGAIVAPAAFAVLPTRTLAGTLVGQVLPTLFWSGAAVGVLVAVLARTDASARTRTVLGLAVAVSCLAAEVIVAPSIARVRAEVAVPIDQLAREDARRVAFGRLHAASVALLGVAGLSGAVALFFTMRAMSSSVARHEISNPLHEP